MRDIDDLAATIEARFATFGTISLAETLARNPQSTIEPPRPDTDDRTRRAIAAWQALASVPTSEGLAVERTLGEGGMGIVRLAEQRSLGRKVAVKTLREGATDRDAVIKLLREAWITGSLEHPNVVPVYDVGLDAAGGPQIVLKRIEGVVWHDVMHEPHEIKQRFGADDPLEWNLAILAQVCRAVHFAHSRGVLHRDIKPGNVMIGEFGEVYVLDWGIAVSLRDDGTGRFPLASDATDLAGTPVYMAPEMLGGESSRLTERTDVYLLGATLHELVIGRPPHEGTTMQTIVASIVKSEPDLAGVSSELAKVIRRALAPKGDDRHASADELRLALERYGKHRGSMRLVERAAESLARLRASIASGEPRRVLYNLLGECRFGYRAALVEFGENDDARIGLRDALLAMVEQELTAGDPESAALLLDEVENAPSELATKVDEARRTRLAEQERVARLQALGRDLDKEPGSRTRAFLAAMLGLLWVFTPMIRLWKPELGTTHTVTIAIDLFMIAITVVLAWWARESMTKTAVNRRLIATLLLTLVGQTVLGFTFLAASMPPVMAHWMHLLIWGLTLGAVAIHLERALALASIVSFSLFFAVARWPSILYPAMSFANFVSVGTMVWVWMPRGAAMFASRPRE